MRMRQVTVCLLLVGAVLGRQVEDKDRACPEGYFYGGEVTGHHHHHPDTRGHHWEKGPASPVYSCYRRLQTEGEGWNWVNASRQCSRDKGGLLSVNNYEETALLTGELFLKNLLKETDNWKEVTLPSNVATSGISLQREEWIWFGAEKSENSIVEPDITKDFDTNDEFTSCLAVTFNRSLDGSVSLSYAPVPCVQNFTEAICEVRVYEQIWYVWFTTNWLQILFILTLVMLLISSCVTFQIWVSRPKRPAMTSSMTCQPPAYSPRDPGPQSAKARMESAAERCAEKGKEIMAKVVFYRKPEDKQRIMTEA